MPKLYTINNTLVSINGYYLGQFDRYNVTVASSEHGSVVATPTRGLIGTTITLSSTPDSGYELDYYTVNGVAIVGNTFTLTGNTTVSAVFNDPYNPLSLPANTVRVRTSDGQAPIKVTTGSTQTTYETATLVTGTNDVYDVYKSGDSFKRLLYESTNVIEVLGANTTGITHMGWMLYDCTSLTSVPLFDTSSVTFMGGMFTHCQITTVPLYDTSSCTNTGTMFSGCEYLTTAPLFDTSLCTNMSAMFSMCTSLTAVPLYNTSSCTNMAMMFMNCKKVESGALALYQQASSQAVPPSSYWSCFDGCGSDTETGRAELLQIPSSWGGTGA